VQPRISYAALTKWASPNEGWVATLTILHEMSHRVINTKEVYIKALSLSDGGRALAADNERGERWLVDLVDRSVRCIGRAD